MSHVYRLSPTCIRLCFLRLLRSLKVWLQSSHSYRSPPLLCVLRQGLLELIVIMNELHSLVLQLVWVFISWSITKSPTPWSASLPCGLRLVNMLVFQSWMLDILCSTMCCWGILTKFPALLDAVWSTSGKCSNTGQDCIKSCSFMSLSSVSTVLLPGSFDEVSVWSLCCICSSATNVPLSAPSSEYRTWQAGPFNCLKTQHTQWVTH